MLGFTTLYSAYFIGTYSVPISWPCSLYFGIIIASVPEFLNTSLSYATLPNNAFGSSTRILCLVPVTGPKPLLIPSSLPFSFDFKNATAKSFLLSASFEYNAIAVSTVSPPALPRTSKNPFIPDSDVLPCINPDANFIRIKSFVLSLPPVRFCILS